MAPQQTMFAPTGPEATDRPAPQQHLWQYCGAVYHLRRLWARLRLGPGQGEAEGTGEGAAGRERTEGREKGSSSILTTNIFLLLDEESLQNYEHKKLWCQWYNCNVDDAVTDLPPVKPHKPYRVLCHTQSYEQMALTCTKCQPYLSIHQSFH